MPDMCTPSPREGLPETHSSTSFIPVVHLHTIVSLQVLTSSSPWALKEDANCSQVFSAVFFLQSKQFLGEELRSDFEE
jgi:hypothetical protein